MRALTLLAGLVGAATASQYPAFTQQYTQRLAGHVDALTEVVQDFDISALNAGLTRTEALAELDGTTFLDARALDMGRTFARHAILSDRLAQLRAANPMERIAMPHYLTEQDILQATWVDFEPAIPLSAAGATTGGLGFVAGWAFIAALLRLMRILFRSRMVPVPPQQPPVRRTPTLQEARAIPPLRPRLMGETRQ